MHHPTHPPVIRSTRPAAFTLIELLVVVAIIVALLAILMPAMAKAMEAANRAVCASNEHQIAIAMLDYAADRFGQLPQAARNTADNHVHPAQIYEPTWRLLADQYGLTPPVMFCPSAYSTGTGNALLPVLDAYPLGGQLNAVNSPTKDDLFFGPDSHNSSWNQDHRRFYGYAIVSMLTGMNCTLPAGEVPISAKRTRDRDINHLLADRNSIRDGASVQPYDVEGISHFVNLAQTVFPTGSNRARLDGSVAWISPEDMGENDSTLRPHPTNPREWDGVAKYHRSSCNHVKERYYW